MRQGLCERISGSFGASFGLERKNKGVRWERQGNNGLCFLFLFPSLSFASTLMTDSLPKR